MIGESKTVLDSEFYVAHGIFFFFFCGKIVAISDYWGSGIRIPPAKDFTNTTCPDSLL